MNPHLRLPIPQRGKPAYHDRAPYGGASRKTAARKIRNALAKVRQKYVYSGLAEGKARLLIIHPPGNGPERLEVDLEEVSFDDLGAANGIPYEALSYHWGAGEEVKPLYVRKERPYHDDASPAPLVADGDEPPRNGAQDGTDEGPRASSQPPSPSRVPQKKFEKLASTLLEKKLYVKMNCYSALRQLRSNTQAIKIWVDVICIDQSNNAEKANQVARMVEIYSRADRVLVWLGDDDRRSQNAFSFIREFVQVEDLDSVVANQRMLKSWGDMVHLMENRWFSRRWVIQEMAYAKEAMLHLADLNLHWDDFRDAVSLFVLNIDKIKTLIQPLLKLSAGVGDDMMLDNIDNNLGNLDFLLHTNLDSLPAKVFIDVLDYMFRKPKNDEGPRPLHGLEYLVSSLYIYENADPRDTIHALFNIATETHWKRRDNSDLTLPTPSYGKNLLEVYAGFVKWVVQSTGSLDILCRKWAVAERRQEPVVYPNPVVLPSWIGVVLAQDRARRGIKNTSFVGLPDSPQYNASHWTKARTIFGIDISENRENGTAASEMMIGSTDDISMRTSVAGLNVIHDNDDLLEEEVRTVRFKNKMFTALSLGSWAKDNLVFAFNMNSHQRERDASLFVQGLQIGEIIWATDPITEGVIPSSAIVKLRENTQQPYPDRLWKTLVAERGPDGRNPPPWYYRACRYCLEHHTPNGLLNTDKLLTQHHPQIVRAFIQRVHDVTWNRRFVQVSDEAKTTSWYGLAPGQARHKDLLCILFGCSVPCILRRHQDLDGDPYYSFIGESYIYGLMDGEALSELDQQQLHHGSRVFRLL